jgi:hypothetical protein
MKKTGRAIAAGLLCAVLLAAARGIPAGQDDAKVGILSAEQVKSLAAAADRTFTSYVPTPEAVKTLQSLLDPVHLMVFFAAWRQEDLKLAASVCLVLEAASNLALTVDYVGVSKDMDSPAALLRENDIKTVPMIVILLQEFEGSRFSPNPSLPIEEELAESIQYARWRIAEEMIFDYEYFRLNIHSDLPLDCTRCHFSFRPGSSLGWNRDSF